MKTTGISTHRTTVQLNPLRVVYHSTTVVEQLPDGRIRLDSGGYHTVTTKRRMNQVGEQFGFKVFQEKRQWYVQNGFLVAPFTDGMVFKPAGFLAFSKTTGA